MTTEELIKLIKESSCLEKFYTDVGDTLTNMTVSGYLEQLLNHHQMTKQSVIKQADFERAFGYQIFSGVRTPRRNALLRIALVMQLSLEETQRLLKIGQRGELYPKNRRDAAIIYCLINNVSLIDTEILLEDINEKLLK